MLRNLLLIALISVVIAGCNKDKCSYNECGLVAPATEIQAVQAYLANAGITNAVQHCSGLFYVIDTPGTGKTPDECDAINATYTGSLTNGSVFDQGTFETPLEGVIPGWRNGLTKIKEGGRIRMYVPPTLGYGPNPYGPIPGNSILIFTVDLNAVL